MTAEAQELERRLYNAMSEQIGELKRGMSELRAEQVEQAKLLATIAANTRPLPELHQRLREVERAQSNDRMAMRIAWAVFLALLGAAWKWLKN